MKNRWALKLFILLLFSGAHPTASGADVYNFYFQKGKAPGTVIQGGDGQKGQVIENGENKELVLEDSEEEKGNVKNDEPSSSKSTLKSEKIADKNIRGKDGQKWTARVGVGSFTFPRVATYHSEGSFYAPSSIDSDLLYDDAHSTVIAGNYHFSRYVDVEVEAQKLNLDSYEWSDKESWVFSAGLGFTPIHISLFGLESVRIGISAGVLRGLRTTDQVGNLIQPEVETGYYISPRIEVAISERMSVQLAAKTDQNYTDSVASSLTLGYDF